VLLLLLAFFLATLNRIPLPDPLSLIPHVAHSRRECGSRVISERLVGAIVVIGVTVREFPLPQSRRDWATPYKLLLKKVTPRFNSPASVSAAAR